MNYLKKFFLILLILCFFQAEIEFLYSQTRNSKKQSKSKKNRTFTANWRNAEIEDFLKGMSAIVNKNILLDDALKGRRITIISRKEIPVKNAYKFMRSVLETLGFGLVETKNLIKVVRLKDALIKAPIVRVGKELVSESALNKNQIITQILNIEHAKAQELEAILRRLTTPETDIIVYRNTNSILLSGTAENVNKLLRVVKQLDVPEEEQEEKKVISAGNVHIYTLEYSESDNMAKVLSQINVPETKSNRDDKNKNRKITVVSHKESNSLIITSKNDEWLKISTIIKNLDKPRKQVFLEMLIVELTAEDLNNFGIDWRIAGQNAPYGQFNSGLATEGGLIDATGQPTNINTLAGFSLGLIQVGGQQILSVLNANAGNNNFNVLSAPQIMTLDNEEAYINVGQDVPVKTQSRNAGAAGANALTIDSYDYRPTGIDLKIKPQVNKNNNIALSILQKVNNISNSSSSVQGGNPTFRKREIKTKINVENKQTIVIGGLISEDKNKNVTSIPILGQIPFFGHLFKRTSIKLVKTNLMVFLTPHIFETREDADKFTARKKLNQELSELEMDRRLNIEQNFLDDSQEL